MYQQGPTRAEIGTLGTIRLKKKFLEVTKKPLQGRKKHQVPSKGLWRPLTHIWKHPPEWFVVGLFTG